MCPACFANLALLVTGFVSTSSIAAGAIKHRKTSAELLEVQKKKIQAKFGSSQLKKEKCNEYRQQSAA